MILAYVGLGSNLGDPVANLQQAYRALSALPETVLIQTSRFYRSSPIDATGPDYINAVALLDTLLDANKLLTACQEIELQQGRTRDYHHAPRTLDLDLLLYGDMTTEETTLTLPHPRLHERAFVLYPLAEINPSVTIPGQPPIDVLLTQVRSQTIQLL